MMENETQGIGPIAKLPVFLDLSGKRAVLAGTSAGIAWKAELIAAAGADVTVFSPEPSAPLDALARAGVAAGTLRTLERRWQPEDLAGAAIATGDFEEVAEAEAFHAAAHAAGVIVNTVDKAATCDFFFGSIVSRSPIVIGITTNGTAPILGQAVRRRVETVLPRWLADWASHAERVRARVKATLKPGAERRRYWEAFVDRAFAAPPAGDDEVLLDTVMADAAPRAAGAVGTFHTVTVGCANPDCLTLRDVRAMQAADVMVLDTGLPPGVSALCRREARRLLVGSGEGQVPPGAAEATVAAMRGEGRAVVRVVLAITCQGC